MTAPNDSDIVLTPETALALSEKFVGSMPVYPGGHASRGIVICGGGIRYFTCAWVCIRMLRRLGCGLPAQIWHLGKRELDRRMAELVRPFKVECIDATAVRNRHPVRILNGWELKPFAILHCPFKEVLLLDADNVPVVNPEFLFETPEFRQTGAIFWPDFGRLEPHRPIWRICGVAYRYEPEFETGQLLMDKERCWRALQLTMWFNEHSDFYYHYVHGDKETFHLAFRKLGQPYSMPATPIYPLDDTMCQHDFDGRRVFQHRNLDKWNLFEPNKAIGDFQYEDECRAYIRELRRLWNGRIGDERCSPSGRTPGELAALRQLTESQFDYHRVGYDRRSMSFLPDGTIGVGAAACERLWDLKSEDGNVILEVAGEEDTVCRLRQSADGVWRGRWLRFEQMPIELTPDLGGNWSKADETE